MVAVPVGEERFDAEGCITRSEHRAGRALTLRGVTFLTLCFFSPLLLPPPLLISRSSPRFNPLKETTDQPCLPPTPSFSIIACHDWKTSPFLLTWWDGKLLKNERERERAIRGKLRGTWNRVGDSLCTSTMRAYCCSSRDEINGSNIFWFLVDWSFFLRELKLLGSGKRGWSFLFFIYDIYLE